MSDATAIVTFTTTSAGPESLPIGAFPDGSLLSRDGLTVVGVDPSAITAGAASALVETSGPTTLTVGAVADTEVLTRSGTTIDGVLPSAMTVGVATYANGVRTTTGPTTLAMGAVADADYLTRSGATVVGKTVVETANAVAATIVDLSLLDGGAATYNWNSTVRELGISHAAAACDVSLPDETQTTNWPVGQCRHLYKRNTSAFGINLLASANVTINGAAGGTDMSPVPGSLIVPSATVNAPYWKVQRISATAFFVFGYVS
jgi:hypothetical protein